MFAILRWVAFAMATVPLCLSAQHPLDVDYSRQTATEERVPTEYRQYDLNERISIKRFDVREWHGNYSTIGRPHPGIRMRGREERSLDHEVRSFETREATMSRFEGRQAYIRNRDEVRRSTEDERAFSGAQVFEFAGPMRRVEQDLGSDTEELTLGEINRFFYMRNEGRRDPDAPLSETITGAGSGQ